MIIVAVWLRTRLPAEVVFSFPTFFVPVQITQQNQFPSGFHVSFYLDGFLWIIVLFLQVFAMANYPLGLHADTGFRGNSHTVLDTINLFMNVISLLGCLLSSTSRWNYSNHVESSYSIAELIHPFNRWAPQWGDVCIIWTGSPTRPPHLLYRPTLIGNGHVIIAWVGLLSKVYQVLCWRMICFNTNWLSVM